ncbi:MAG: hypothetical protein CMF67_10490 [Magnetovibrio sp.]|nr:hypothetical protein [Magnetovibrio sp.]
MRRGYSLSNSFGRALFNLITTACPNLARLVLLRERKLIVIFRVVYFNFSQVTWFIVRVELGPVDAPSWKFEIMGSNELAKHISLNNSEKFRANLIAHGEDTLRPWLSSGHRSQRNITQSLFSYRHASLASRYLTPVLIEGIPHALSRLGERNTVDV